MSKDLLDLSELLRRRALRTAAIRSLTLTDQAPRFRRALDANEAVQVAYRSTAPFSPCDRESAWGIAAALSLPNLPACQTLSIIMGSHELLSNVTRAVPNLLTLKYAPALPFAHSITARLDPPFTDLRLTSLDVGVFDNRSLQLALRLIRTSERTLTSLQLRLRTTPGQKEVAICTQLGSTVTYPSLHKLRELHVPVMFCPPPSVGSGVTSMSISHHKYEYHGRGRSRVRPRMHLQTRLPKSSGSIYRPDQP